MGLLPPEPAGRCFAAGADLRGKVVDFLFELANVTDKKVSREELFGSRTTNRPPDRTAHFCTVTCDGALTVSVPFALSRDLRLGGRENRSPRRRLRLIWP